MMKNRFTIDGPMAIIYLRLKDGSETPCMVDAEDVPKLQAFPLWWHMRKSLEYKYVEHDCITIGGKRVRVNMASVVMGTDQRVHRRSAGPLNLCKSNLVIGADPICGKCGGKRKPLGAKGKLFCLACMSSCEKKSRMDPSKRPIWTAKYRRQELSRRRRDHFCRYRSIGIPVQLIRDLFAAQIGRCALSGRIISIEDAHLDHIVPKKRGGGTDISNLRFLSSEVNMAKRHLLDSEFISLCYDVSNHRTASKVNDALENPSK